MQVVTPETQSEIVNDNKKIFLAGTIDNGHSINWEQEVINRLKEKNADITIYNPRRDNWNENATAIDVCKQIEWEQIHLDKADLIIMVLADDSKSPISLLELGLYAKENKIIVFCTDKFYRWHNVWMTCKKYNIPLYSKINAKDIANVIMTH